MTIVDCQLFDTGYCLVSEHHMMAGAAQRKIACHALVALLKHPEYGYVLWDVGYAPRIFEATERLPYRVQRWTTPLYLNPELTLVRQLQARQIAPEAIGRIIVSHFHGDHIAGLLDFPAAKLIARKTAYDHVVGQHGLAAMRRGFLPGLMPADFAARAQLLPAFSSPALPGLGPTHDLFGDGSMVLVELPGHARGQIGLLANTQRGRILFAADGAWHSQAIREVRPPHAVTRVFVDDFAAVRTTLEGLQRFAQALPDVEIMPTHCPEVYAREFGP